MIVMPNREIITCAVAGGRWEMILKIRRSRLGVRVDGQDIPGRRGMLPGSSARKVCVRSVWMKNCRHRRTAYNTEVLGFGELYYVCVCGVGGIIQDF